MKKFLWTNFFNSHIRHESFRNFNGAVGLLIIFENGGDRPADRDTGAVKRVNEFDLGFIIAVCNEKIFMDEFLQLPYKAREL